MADDVIVKVVPTTAVEEIAIAEFEKWIVATATEAFRRGVPSSAINALLGLALGKIIGHVPTEEGRAMSRQELIDNIDVGIDGYVNGRDGGRFAQALSAEPSKSGAN